MAVLILLGVDALVGTVWAVTGEGLTMAVEEAVEGSASLLRNAVFLVLLLAARNLAHLAVAGTFMAWLLVTRLNAESLTRVPHRWLKIFIFLGWIFPIVGWWIPKQIVDDIWASSRPGGVRGEHIGREPHSWLVWAWWVSWLLAFWVVPVSFVLLMSFADRSPEEIAIGAGLGLDVFTLVASLVAAALLAVVVVRITRFQEGRIRVDSQG
ncbi:DUF4328 domain-containing protein [Streptosporangium sp. NPDC051022]|uniref:DUF4328 domain-containing protein n=1 Tax=Streptosporangium sp. NPDC051022 TaxID=3155752 RepID=UPI003413B1E7